jgi:dolichyl-phosphate beta-glucosyltransferase
MAGSDEQGRTMMRELMSSTMRRLTSLLGRPPEIVDTQCGFKMFTESAADLLFTLQREDGFAFDVELILLASSFNFNLQAMPVAWIDAPGSTVDPIKDSLKMLRAMLRIRKETKETDRAIRRDPI